MEGLVQWHVIVFFAANPVVYSVCELRENHYHSYEEMTAFLKHINNSFHHLARLYSIGRSADNRSPKNLWVIEISGGNKSELLRPNIKLVANIHGTEAVGRELLLKFIEYLVEEYGKRNPDVVKLLEYAKVHVLPSINPDGFDMALNHFNKNNASLNGIYDEGWTNFNFEDLNSCFPIKTNKSILEILAPESVAVMRWMEKTPFVLSLSLKGTSLVATYPYDIKQGSEDLTKDNLVFKSLAFLYSKNHPTMSKGCPYNYHNKSPLVFKDGITNGLAWFPIKDSMQDYNYIIHGCLEVTVEISCERFPSPNTLPSFWQNNNKSIMQFLMAIQRGIRGFVKDEMGSFVPNATLTINGSPSRISSHGEYWKILLPEIHWQYIVNVKAVGFETLEEVIVLKDTTQRMPTVFNFTLRREISSTNPTTAESTESNILDLSSNIQFDLILLVISVVVLGIIIFLVVLFVVKYTEQSL